MMSKNIDRHIHHGFKLYGHCEKRRIVIGGTLPYLIIGRGRSCMDGMEIFPHIVRLEGSK